MRIPVEKLGMAFTAVFVDRPGFSFPEKAALEKFIPLDTETTEIKYDGSELQGVILQVCFMRSKTVHIVPWYFWDEYLYELQNLYPKGVDLVFHNAAFDLKVLDFTQRPWLWDLFWKGRVKDTMIRFVQKMQAAGEYFPSLKLKDISNKLLGIDLSKDEAIRLTYTRDMVMSEGHFKYGAMDPIATGLCWKKLGDVLPDRGAECEQVALMGAIALESVRDNGQVVDFQEYTRMRRLLVQNVDGYSNYLRHWGVEEGIKGNKATQQKILKHLEERLGVQMPRTPKSGEIKLNDLVIAQLSEDKRHPFLENWCRFVGSRQILSHFFKDDLEAAGWMGATADEAEPEELLIEEKCPEALLLPDEDGEGVIITEDDDGEEVIIPIKIHSDGRIHPRYQWATATGRTQCSGPNAQNFPRKCELHWKENGVWRVEKLSIRGYIIPTPGYAINSTDFNQLELCGLGEHCKVFLGRSQMADLINAGIDLHTWFGEEICKSEGVVWKTLTDDEKGVYRSFAKVCNFGIPGGLGPKKLVEFALKNYGIKLSVDKAKELKKLWLESFSEMKDFFGKMELDQDGSRKALWTQSKVLDLENAGIKTPEDLENAILMKEFDHARSLYAKGKEREAKAVEEAAKDKAHELSFGLMRYVCHTFTGRTTSNKLYNACANMAFQGPCADAAKKGLFNLWVNSYRIVNFVHDEAICEIKLDAELSQKAQRQADLFVEGAQSLFKHVKLKAEPALMLRWDKGAEACYNADGELQIWTPDIVKKNKDIEKIKEGSWASSWRELHKKNGGLYGLQPLKTAREIAEKMVG